MSHPVVIDYVPAFVHTARRTYRLEHLIKITFIQHTCFSLLIQIERTKNQYIKRWFLISKNQIKYVNFFPIHTPRHNFSQPSKTMKTSAAFSALLGLFCNFSHVQGDLVQVDLQPCILAPTEISRDESTSPESYMVSEFYRGFWGASQHTPSFTTGTLDLTNSETHGKCNVVYVGFPVTEAQKLQLQDYSRTFNVRIVYFNSAESSNDPEVNVRLGISQNFNSLDILEAPAIRLTDEASESARVVVENLSTNPRVFNIFTRPVIKVNPAVEGIDTVVAEYVDDNGGNTFSNTDPPFPSVAAMAYVSDDGYEEIYYFFSMAWFDIGSLAWIHHAVEWGTKGVFQGERRFHLAGVVDDLFLSTGEFMFDGDTNSGPPQRMTADDFETFASFEADLNSRYGSSIVTEWAFNAMGVLIEANSNYQLFAEDSEIALLTKGDQVQGDGVPPQFPTDWLSTSIDGMREEFESGAWGSDDLLAWVIDNMGDFWWQSHTLTHISRDNLGASDCAIEDGGNAQFAVITGLFDSPNYNWRSMTSPRITGLFNKFCLESGRANLMTCYPGKWIVWLLFNNFY